jgi:IMP dehydrogenase
MFSLKRALSYSDVSMVPRYSGTLSKSEVDLVVDYSQLPIPFEAIPVWNAPMDTVCSPELCGYLNENGYVTTIHRFFDSVGDQVDFYRKCNFKYPRRVFISVGSVHKWEDWIDNLLDMAEDFGILVDMANGDTKTCIDTVAYIRSRRTLKNIMAGNIATRSAYEHLAEAGANLVRVGVGGGSICTTRLKTGFGVPVFTSVLACCGAKIDGVYIIADGGIEHAGDMAKAMAVGADGCMLGKLLAGTSLSGGHKLDNGMVVYNGAASRDARSKLGEKNSGSIEGVEGQIPYTGTTEDFLGDWCENLRSAVSYYGGCRNWKDFSRTSKFVEITSTGLMESGIRVST